MILEKSLEKYGLNKKEAKIYLALLELGEATVFEIAKKARIKRPTSYIILDSLLEKGLVLEIPKNNKKLYAPENPNYLFTDIKEKEKLLRDILPKLKSLYDTNEYRPKIKFFDGREGVKKIYNELLQAKKYIFFYGSIKDIMRNFPGSLLTIKQIKKMNIPVKEIITSDQFDLDYGRRVIRAGNPNHQIRTVKLGTYFILDSAVFDDKIAIMSIEKNFFGIIIESKELANSFKILYELAWQSAEEIKLYN